MRINRRKFVKTTIAAGALTTLNMRFPDYSFISSGNKEIQEALSQPIFKESLFKNPVIIDNIELLQYKKNFILRVRSKDGIEGISVSNNRHMEYMYPILQQRVIPFFIGKDVRKLDDLIEEVFLYKSNYKLQGLALWIPVATVEFALLDMMGKIAEKPVAELIGKFYNKKISVYRSTS